MGIQPISAPSYAEQLLRALDIKGDLPGELETRWGASYQLDDLRQPEFWWLRRGRRWSQSVQIGASVGNFGFVEAFISTAHPVGTIMALVEQIHISSSTTAMVGIALRPLPALGAVTTTQFANLDDRQAPFVVGSPVAQLPALALAQGVNAAIANTGVITNQALRVAAPAAATVNLAIPFVLTGRAILRVVCQTANVELEVGFTWREREMLTSEL